jgi:hypothetical protein
LGVYPLLRIAYYYLLADMSSGEQRANSTEHHVAGSTALLGDARPQRLEAARRKHPPRHWWLVAASSALLLTLLTLAGVRLVTRQPAIVDQVVILTVPSGADITFDSKPLGQSPVKLEKVQAGIHKLEISKDGFEQIVQEVPISGPQVEPQVLEFKLRPLQPPEAMGLSPEERIKQYRQRAEEAFARGNYAIPIERSALYYAQLILAIDDSNQFAIEMLERVRKALHQAAQSAISRGDFAQAQEIYSVLIEYYPKDEVARAAAAKLESQLTARRGEVRDLVRKAEEALRSGRLIEPARASAYYFSKQALAIDRQNAQARAIRNQIREKLVLEIERAIANNQISDALRKLETATQLFPEDKELLARRRQLESQRAAEASKANDPAARRLQGLEKYMREEFAEAASDLEFAASNGYNTPEVIFALGRSYIKLHQLDRAAAYLRQVPQSAGDAYCSAIAALGDIALEQGDVNTAIERYRQARKLGGSTLYSALILDDKIERIEKRLREKAAEPTPISIQVKHPHSFGSCSGILTVDSTGVRYNPTDGDHTFAANLMAVSVLISKDEMSVRANNKTYKFKFATRADAERFREMLARYQSYTSSIR